jgi:hypothetical protein
MTDKAMAMASMIMIAIEHMSSVHDLRPFSIVLITESAQRKREDAVVWEGQNRQKKMCE